MSLAVEEVAYRKLDYYHKVVVPSKMRQMLGLKRGSYVELQLHVIDNVPAIVLTAAQNGRKK